jgi:hypothetical protein
VNGELLAGVNGMSGIGQDLVPEFRRALMLAFSFGH